jgi:hypothetical protein
MIPGQLANNLDRGKLAGNPRGDILPLFFQEEVWGNLAFSQKAGFPQILVLASSLKLRQAVGQALGVGEEALDRRVP